MKELQAQFKGLKICAIWLQRNLDSNGRTSGDVLSTIAKNPLFLEEGSTADWAYANMISGVVADYSNLVAKTFEGDGKAAGELFV